MSPVIVLVGVSLASILPFTTLGGKNNLMTPPPRLRDLDDQTVYCTQSGEVGSYASTTTRRLLAEHINNSYTILKEENDG